MDKFGWQRPNIDVGMTGIQKCIQTRKAQKHAEAVEIIAQGNLVSYNIVTDGGHNH
tara:strand:+ start:528 stop:695 length:168 start_codon:yes stop_codon:yes gene_type:complete